MPTPVRSVVSSLALTAAITAVAMACSSSGTLVPGPDSGTPAEASGGDAGNLDAQSDSAEQGDALLVPPPITRTEGEGQLAPQRQACAFEAGAWPAQTLGVEDPVGADIPVDHVIVIVQENRSFDHYLGRLVAQGYYSAGDFSGAVDDGTDAGNGSGFTHSDQLDAPPAGWSNPDVDGGRVVPHPDTEYCYGVNHSWGAMHDDYDDGKLDHFVLQNDPDGQRTFFYEDDTVIPFYYALASTFSVGDHYHASVMTSTWPNRLYLMAATSFGLGDNSFVTLDTAAHPVTQIFSQLEAGGHTWKDYTDGPHMLSFFSWFGFQPSIRSHVGNVRCDLLTDIQKDTLPDVSFVMGDEVDESSDEGPSDLPGIGGALVEQIIRALWTSPSWKSTAVFIVYDENGGLADHVQPAPACEPDKYAPHDGNGNALPGAFDRTGFRVPFILVSPYAKGHFVSHTTYDHTSITRFIEARFGLPAMTARDANATPPYEMFDFAHPPFMTPPSVTAHTTVPPAILKQCGQTMAPFGCQ